LACYLLPFQNLPSSFGDLLIYKKFWKWQRKENRGIKFPSRLLLLPCFCGDGRLENAGSGNAKETVSLGLLREKIRLGLQL